MPTLDSPTLALLADAARPFVSVAGAAFAANSFITALRQNNPLPKERPVSLPYRVLYAPRYARILAIVFAVVISIGASALVALAAGQPVAMSIDTALSAVLAALGSQLIHGFSLSAEVPALDAPETTEQPKLLLSPEEFGRVMEALRLERPTLTDDHLARLDTIMNPQQPVELEITTFGDQAEGKEVFLTLKDGTEVDVRLERRSSEEAGQ